MVKVNPIPVFGEKKPLLFVGKFSPKFPSKSSTLQNTDWPVFFKLGSCRLCEGFGYNSRKCSGIVMCHFFLLREITYLPSKDFVVNYDFELILGLEF